MTNRILLVSIVLCLILGNDTSEFIQHNGNCYIVALILLTGLIYRIFK